MLTYEGYKMNDAAITVIRALNITLSREQEERMLIALLMLKNRTFDSDEAVDLREFVQECFPNLYNEIYESHKQHTLKINCEITLREANYLMGILEEDKKINDANGAAHSNKTLKSLSHKLYPAVSILIFGSEIKNES